MPCANPINCPGVDRPVINVTAETPDVIKTFGYGYFSDGRVIVCAEITQEIADACALVSDPDNFDDLSNPPPPVIYTSTEQSCTVDCPGGGTSSYTAPAGSAVGFSQAAANASALEFACEIALLLCDGSVDVITNQAQTCNVTCSNGQIVSYTVAAGMFSGASLAAANASALAFACEVAALLCPSLPPGPGGGGGGGGGAGNPPSTNPHPQPRFGNSQQSCSVACADGGVSTFTVAAGTYIAESLAAANAIASSIACRRAYEQLACIGLVNPEACVGEFYSQVLQVSNLTEPLVWSVTSGSLPPGVELADDLLLGAPTLAGTYLFTIGVLQTSTGVFTSRASSIKVMGISTAAALPAATQGSPYSEALVGAGYTGTPVWSLESGALPDGLSLDSATGVISGTPTETGDFNIVVGLTDEDGQVCSKAFTLNVSGSAIAAVEYWNMQEASGNRVGLVAGNILLESVSGGSTILGGAGLISDGAIYSKALASFSCTLTMGTFQASLVFDITQGFSFCGWCRRISGSTSDFTQRGSLELRDPTGLTALGILGFEHTAGNFEVYVASEGTPVAESVTTFEATPPLGDWFFVAIHYDPVTNTAKASFNDGVVSETAAVVAIPAFQTARVILGGSLLAGASSWQHDEWGVFSPMLTPEQVTHLYNAGAGRTYPF